MMSSAKTRLPLGDSWVVEGEEEYSPKDEEEYIPPTTRKTTPPKHPTRRNDKSPEPELVMPSLDIESLDGSWAGASSRSAKARPTRLAGKALEGRRRSTRTGISTASPEKRTRFKTSTNEPPSPPANKKDDNTFKEVLDVALKHVFVVLLWVLEVIGGALKVLKKPLSYFVAIWLLFGLIVVARNLVTSSIYASLSPLCRIPGSSLLNFPFCPVHRVDTSNGPPPSVEFDQLMTVQSKFEEVLEESAGGVSLPLDMKRGEASIRDLRQRVRYSHLHSKYVFSVLAC